MKMRNLQTIADDTEKTPPSAIKTDSDTAANFVEINKLGVQKYLVEKDYRQASVFFTKALEIEPGCFACKFNLGRAFLSAQKLDDAIKIFNELAAVDQKNADVLASLGEAYTEKEFYGESVEYFRQSLKLNPNDAVTFSNYAISLSRLGKLDEALTNLDKALKLQPDFAEAYSNRGYALFLLGRQKDALESLQKAVKLNDGIAQIHNNLGVVLEYFGKKAEAKKHYLEAVRLKPDYGEGICNLALVYLQNGDREAAYAQLKTLEKVDFKLAGQLRDAIWGKYVIDASKVKTKN
jgi:tetratricopeptide (TPR) repeat protein